jgi:hypothetical protein
VGQRMLRIATPPEIVNARSALRSRLWAGAERIRRRIATPGGPFDQEPLYWRADPGIWSYVGNQPWPGADRPRWPFAYGTKIGTEAETLTPSIEINIPDGYETKRLAGRILVDEHGHFYLGHSGGLRGGRGGEVTKEEFDRLIRGFVKDQVEWSINETELAFVIGAINAPDFINRLHAYVREAERLRALARTGKKLAALEHAPPQFKKGSHGKSIGRRTPEYEIERYHEKNRRFSP